MHWDTRDDQACNQASPEEALNRAASIQVEVLGPAVRQGGNDMGRWPSHLLNSAAAATVSGIYDRFDRLPEIRAALEVLIREDEKQGEVVDFGRAASAPR